MTTLTSLPTEVIDIILSFDDISFEDIINLRCVCKQFRNAAKTTDYCFQKKKFFQRWPSAKRYYYELPKKNEQNSKKNKQKDRKFISFIETGINCARQLQKYMIQIMYISHCDNVDHKINCGRRLYKDLKKKGVLKTENYTLLCFMDEIEHLLTRPQRAGYNLMGGYCHIKLFDYLRKYWREYIFNRHIKNKSYHKKLLEECAAILAQHLQPKKDVSYSSVKQSLNIIALDALNFLKTKHPDHSIFSTSDECFSEWKNNNIYDNYWSEAESTQIMDTLEEFMFGKLEFRSIDSRELEYTCIDYVLKNKCGQDFILFIIYQSVARRLGLRCDIVSNPDSVHETEHYFKLFWAPKYNFSADYEINISDVIDRNGTRCYIRIKFDKFPKCIVKYNHYVIQKQTFAEMLENTLYREGVFLYNFENDNFKIYDEIRYRFPQVRPQRVKFAVGMIVTHGGKSTDCSTGVIIGWYQRKFNDIFDCKKLEDIAEYVMPLKMCGNFSVTGKRIYYVILTKNAKLCFVQQDTITLAKPNWIENRNIYRYFYKFEGTHYVPNNMLARVYPHDAAIAAKTIFEN